MTDPKHTEPRDLLPCPFCGDHPVVMDSGSGEYWVQCLGCWGTGGVDCGTSQAIAAWNTRTAAEAASRVAFSAVADHLEEKANEDPYGPRWAPLRYAAAKIRAALSPADGGDHG